MQKNSNPLSGERKEGAAEEIAPEQIAPEERQFILTYIQPGLAGLIDGSISTLAPIFAVAFATQDSRTTLLVGLAAALGAGISMGFTEVASDDGVVSGRGSPIKRGLSTGIMTTLGGLGHALPYLLTNFVLATVIAVIVVGIELAVIVYIQNRFLRMPWRKAFLQVVIGGIIVFAVGIGIGSA